MSNLIEKMVRYSYRSYSPSLYLRSYGDYSGGDHLFPFRTEKLSPPAQMVLHYNAEEYVVADLF